MFKVGDEVLCVDDLNINSYVTEGNVYKVLTDWAVSNMIGITTDPGTYNTFYYTRFIPNTPEAKARYMREKLEKGDA